MRRTTLCISLAAAAVLIAGIAARSMAIDPPAEKAAGKAGTKPIDPSKKGEKATASDVDEWKKLVARRDEIEAEMGKLQKAAATADFATRQKIIQRFQELNGEYQNDVRKRLNELATRAHAADPTDPVAAEVVMTDAISKMKYAETLAMAEKVIAANKATLPVLAQKAEAQFDTNDFEGAKKTLDEAKAMDARLFAKLTPLLGEVTAYLGYWKEELARREKEAEANDLPRVRLKTTRGDIVLELFENEAPNTVANFVSLIEKKKYDGNVIHRVEPNFVMQAGDFNRANRSRLGPPDPPYNIACECYRDDTRMHFQGSLSMAHAGRDTGTSQFFITHRPTAHLNYVKGKPDVNHTVFGRVIEGMDVVLALKVDDKIESATVLRKREHPYVPVTLVEQRKLDAQKGAKAIGTDKK